MSMKEAGKCKKGDICLMKDRPVKVVSTTHCKTGKHGSGKNNFVTLDIFTNKKIMFMCPSYTMITLPDIITKKYSITNMEDGTIDGFDLDEEEEVQGLIDIDEEDEYYEKIKEMYDDDKEVIISVMSYEDEAKITDVKEGNED